MLFGNKWEKPPSSFRVPRVHCRDIQILHTITFNNIVPSYIIHTIQLDKTNQPISASSAPA